MTNPNDLESEFNSPLMQEHWKNLCTTQYDDCYDHVRRETVYCEVGLEDGPIQDFSVRRGATVDECMDELRSLQQIHEEYDPNDDYFDSNDAPNDALKAHLARCDKFAKAHPWDIYLVFHEDCQELDPPVIDPRKTAQPNNDWWGKFYDEWNVLANWCDDNPDFLAVWDRRKIPFAEACTRISEMKPLPPPEILPFTIDPSYKQAIDDLLLSLVPIADEATAPYKLVMEQKALRNKLAQYYAILASKKLMLLIGGTKPQHVGVQQGYKEYGLYMQLCQYDDWNGWFDFFKQHMTIGDWPERQYEKFPTAFYDLSADPDFAQAEQKIYPVSVIFYDSHASGF